MKSKHPFDPFVENTSTKLIIGTIPPHRYCITPQKLFENDVNFYYGSKDNYFWEIIGEIFNCNFNYSNTEKAVAERKDFLRKNKTGITDIIDTCTRVKESAADKNLENIKYKNIKQLLIDNQQIDTLIYTSGFVKKCMNEYFQTYHNIDKTDKRKNKLKIGDKIYNVFILYSPSPQGLRNMGKNGKEKRNRIYSEVFKK